MRKTYLVPETEITTVVIEKNFLGTGDRNMTTGSSLNASDFVDD